MEVWLWVVIGILILIILALLIKIHLFRKAASEMEAAFDEQLTTDTNALITISSNDRTMRKLANAINRQLRELRRERHRFCQGDMELKNAITNISHDLRTPLTAICGYLELLEQEAISEQVSRYIEIIRNRTEVLKQLTEELFCYSVILTKEMDLAREPVVINGVLEESVAAFYTDFCDRHIIPDIRIPKEKVVRHLDRSALSRVFSNLLNNAIKYSEGDLAIMLSESGEITFSNTVYGLNEVQIGKLFERFYTVEAARKSTGLGLSIARTLVEQMDGTISAVYENNRLCIRLRFP